MAIKRKKQQPNSNSNRNNKSIVIITNIGQVIAYHIRNQWLFSINKTKS